MMSGDIQTKEAGMEKFRGLKRREWARILLGSGAICFFVLKIGASVSSPGGWNKASRLAELYAALGIYDLRSELTTTVLFVVSLAATLLLFTRPVHPDRTVRRVARVLAILFSVQLVIGNFAVHSEVVFAGGWSLAKAAAFLIEIPGLFLLIRRLLEMLFTRLKTANPVFGPAKGSFRPGSGRLLRLLPGADDRHALMKIWLLILACYLPYYVVNYPGVIPLDAFRQLSQVLGIAPWVDDHPAAHTALIGLASWFSSLFQEGSTLTFAIYTALQCLAVSFVYAYLIHWLIMNRANRLFTFLAFAYFALMPMHAYNSVYVVKDILSAATLTLCALLLIGFIHEDRKSFRQLFFFGAAFVAAALLRNHVYYILNSQQHIAC